MLHYNCKQKPIIAKHQDKEECHQGWYRTKRKEMRDHLEWQEDGNAQTQFCPKPSIDYLGLGIYTQSITTLKLVAHDHQNESIGTTNNLKHKSEV